MSEPFVFNAFVNSTVMLDKEPKDGDSCVVVGWGTTAESTYVDPECPHHVTVPVVPRERCANSAAQRQVKMEQLCAGMTGKGFCGVRRLYPLIPKD